jgi:hypothetical protein
MNNSLLATGVGIVPKTVIIIDARVSIDVDRGTTP